MAPTTVQDLPDHLLHRVFRLLNTHDSVVRAAAVCTRWRRMASTHGLDMCWFRHDFSTVIGHYYAVDPSFSLSPGPKKKKQPASELEQPQRRRHPVVFVPASPSIEPRHFSLDFLPTSPGGRPWELVDGCGSLLLLASQRRELFPDLVVCEPISRRCVRIQPIPDMKYSRCLGAFLTYPHNVITISCFRVTCVLHDRANGVADGSTVTARVFNHEVPPIPNCWNRSCWDMSRAASSSCLHLLGVESARFAGRDWSWSFWWIEEDGTVFSHSISDGKYKDFHLPEHVVVEPPEPQQRSTTTFRFVESTAPVPAGGVKLVTLVGDELRVFVNQEYYHYHHGGASEWVHERSLRLPEATRGLPGHKESYFGATAKIVAAGRGYVVLTPAEGTWVFSVDLGTMQVEREHVRNRLPGKVYPYKLATRPRVHACLVRCKMWRRGKCKESCKCT